MINKKQYVLDYIQGHRHDPLHFMTSRHVYADLPDRIEMPVYSTVRGYVKTVISLAYSYNSVSSTETCVETYSGKLRSAIDIWRHIIDVRPETTIFEVMRAIYKLIQKNRLGGHYCSVVRRRVFWGIRLSNLNIYNEDVLDEFGLVFDDWKDIGIEKEVVNV